MDEGWIALLKKYRGRWREIRRLRSAFPEDEAVQADADYAEKLLLEFIVSEHEVGEIKQELQAEREGLKADKEEMAETKRRIQVAEEERAEIKRWIEALRDRAHAR